MYVATKQCLDPSYIVPPEPKSQRWIREAVSRTTKTQGREVDQTSLTMGCPSTVPGHVMSGRSLVAACSRTDPSSEPASWGVIQ